jgi:hypothetical protein
MGNKSSKAADNENFVSSGASNAIKNFNENLGMQPNKEKRELEFRILSAESSISVTKENITVFTNKLNREQEQLKNLEATLADAKSKLASLNSSSSGASGGTRKKILNKNNRKTRTSCKK